MTPALSGVGLLVLSAGVAGADTYKVLEGRLTDAATGAVRPISGELELRLLEGGEPTDPPTTSLIADDFALRAGRRTLTAAGPIEYGGVASSFPQIADSILLEGDSVAFARLRAGGEVLSADDERVTFRFLELRSHAPSDGHARGTNDDGLPRSLRLEGTLVQVDQTFRLPDPDDCLAPPQPLPLPTPLPGGGGVVISGNTIVDYETFDVAAGEIVLFERPAAAGSVLNRVTGSGPSQIEGSLHSGGSVVMLNPAGINLNSAATITSSHVVVPVSASELQASTLTLTAVSVALATPTLEQLGMRAPQGATVTLDAGALKVETAGDLFVEGVFPEIPGLVSVTLIAGGDVRVTDTASFHVPAGVSISIWAGGSFHGPLPVPPPIVLPPVGFPPVCRGLRPEVPAAQRVLGEFSLVASTAQPVAIDVEPADARNRIQPGARKPIAVALFGSRSLDVRDVIPGSLRLGPGEAGPLSRFDSSSAGPPVGSGGRPHVFRLRLNRDRYPDLVAFFSPRDAEVAYGDTELCLVAETGDGTTIEGCDAIVTGPVPLRGRSPR